MGKKATASAPPPSETESDTWVTRAWVAKHWIISEDTVDRMVDRGVLPAYRVGNGRNIRFKRADIDALAHRIA